MRRLERWCHRLDRQLARYRTNLAVLLAAGIAIVAALIAASVLL